MIKMPILLVIFTALVLPLPAHAGHGTIQETDSQIIVEYSGGEDDAKTAKEHQEELEAQRQAEQAEVKKKETEDRVHEQKIETITQKKILRGY